MTTAHINLARKWRSKQFETVIGQDIVVRMLKNSLYLGYYFPVYLFSGQRGCGKTTTARVFAAAVNCEQYAQFQQQPKQYTIPCGTCLSCTTMLEHKHPDFIEIDAASHTGVDNVRQIIDASSFLPLMGQKKIYLIDEAHMLSKAAFNAFLKILEEPPATVLFILATTDQQKIIETVRSRCFQLFFAPVAHEVMLNHLTHVCQAENIVYDRDALSLIVQASEGSVRDALNLLEQTRFSASQVDKQAVLAALGQLSSEQLVQLFQAVLHKTSAALLTSIAALNLETYEAEKIYTALLDGVRISVWLSQGVRPPGVSDADVEQLTSVIKGVSRQRLSTMLELLSSSELSLSRTTKKHLLLELLLLKMCQTGTGHVDATSGNTPDVSPVKESGHTAPQQMAPTPPTSIVSAPAKTTQWSSFLVALKDLDDPLLTSIFTQARFDGYDAPTGAVELGFSEQFSFFQDWLTDTSSRWLPMLKTIFGEQAQVRSTFKGHDMQSLEKNMPAERASQEEKVVMEKKTVEHSPKVIMHKKPFVKKSEHQGGSIDVSDSQKWQKAQLLLSYFPGTITQLQELYEKAE